MSLPAYRLAHEWRAKLDKFLDRFPSWRQWFDGDEPVYFLPPRLITLLGPVDSQGREQAGQKRFLTPPEAEAEREFTALCFRSHPHAVGLWRKGLICHYPLSESPAVGDELSAGEEVASEERPRTPIFRDEDGFHPCDFLGRASTWGCWNLPDVVQSFEEKEEFKHSVLGCIGHLEFLPEFRDDVRSLQALWSRLPRCMQIPINDPCTEQRRKLHRDVLVDPDVMATCFRFSSEYRSVLERWALAGFSTWHLPIIHPPLIGVSLLEATQILPLTARVIYWPPHLARPSSLDLNAVLENLQWGEHEVRQDVVEDDQESVPIACRFPFVPGRRRALQLSNNEQTLQMSDNEKTIRMMIAERALRERYSERRGQATRFVEAVKVWFGLKSEQAVDNLRNRYVRLWKSER